MKRCRTKAGTLPLRYEGSDYLLDGDGLLLPDDLAESIRGHVNVIVEDDPHPAAPVVEEKRPKKSKDAESEG